MAANSTITKEKKRKKKGNGTSSRHLALLTDQPPSPHQCSVDQEEAGLPASLLSLAWRCITISLATQLMFVAAAETPTLKAKRCKLTWFLGWIQNKKGPCTHFSSVSGLIPGCFPKKKLDHQWPESCFGSPAETPSVWLFLNIKFLSSVQRLNWTSQLLSRATCPLLVYWMLFVGSWHY